MPLGTFVALGTHTVSMAYGIALLANPKELQKRALVQDYPMKISQKSVKTEDKISGQTTVRSRRLESYLAVRF